MDIPIVAGGREVPDALDRVRRYCGLVWSGGPSETWAWHYYDAVPTRSDNLVSEVDVLCAAALHPGLARSDLAFFLEGQAEVAEWLSKVPTDRKLRDASDDDLDHLASLPAVFDGMSLSLLSKVLHRKRPHLIPLIDRHIVDWYRPLTDKRAMSEAWDPILRAMQQDQSDHERSLLYAIAFGGIESQLWPGSEADDRPRLSWLRGVDIAIWMGAR